MSLCTDENGANFKLVAVPYDETFDSQATLRCISKAFSGIGENRFVWHTNERIESITLLGKIESTPQHVQQVCATFGATPITSKHTTHNAPAITLRHDGAQWKLPLDMRPVDLELPGNEGLRSVVFKQQWTWRVNIVIDKQPREHE